MNLTCDRLLVVHDPHAHRKNNNPAYTCVVYTMANLLRLVTPGSYHVPNAWEGLKSARD
jgi:hypothetical protein